MGVSISAFIGGDKCVPCMSFVLASSMKPTVPSSPWVVGARTHMVEKSDCPVQQ